ncbi:MAG: hypothetical protein WC009_12990 [Methylotenera sp.]|jgi:hypothetical protein
MSTKRKNNIYGLDYKRPIALRLMPEERRQADLLSKRFGKSNAAFAREAYLAGLPLIIDSSNTPAATLAVSSSGAGCISGTASFYSKPAGQS